MVSNETRKQRRERERAEAAANKVAGLSQGANLTTVIKFSDDVTLEGNKVAAGEYGLFSIPGENQWTIILSKKSKQWGA
jgi:hypothetical protein